ncbi:MAG: hypothetical protein AAGA54_23150 [Myxococcota bacterium]
MRSTAVLLALAFAGACADEAPPEAPPPPAVVAPTPAPGPAAEPTPARAPALPPLGETEQARVRTLAETFAKGGCTDEPVQALRALTAVHGDQGPLRKAQLLMFEACQDAVGKAELLARTLPADADADARLQMGAAWIRAARYDEAVAVLRPLSVEQGPASKAAWLAGFATFHAGDPEAALPLLEGARAQAPTDRSDAWLLIGLSKLHAGDADGAVAEFEAGNAAVPGDRSMLQGLARGYAALGRTEDARTTTLAARAAHEGAAAKEQAAYRLSALATQLRTAHKDGDLETLEKTFDMMWPMAPTKLRAQMLAVRAAAYDRAGRPEDAAASRAQAQALPQGDTAP